MSAASMRRWRERNPEAREKNRANVAAWRIAHPEEAASGVRSAKAKNPEKYRAINAASQSRCGAQRAEAQRRRRALKAGTTVVRVTPEHLCQKLAYWGGKCWICREAPGTQWDHVKPLAAGGRHVLSNLRPACPRCNQSKGMQWPFEVMA